MSNELTMEDLDKDNLARKTVPVKFWKSDEEGFTEIKLIIKRIGPLEFQSVITAQEIEDLNKTIINTKQDTFTKEELLHLIVSASESNAMKELDIISRLLEKACITPKLPKEYWLKFLDRMPSIRAVLELSTVLTTFAFVDEAEIQQIKN